VVFEALSTAMTAYFFPCLILVPKFEGNSLKFAGITVHRRLWETSTFDLATLETKHVLHLPYQLMDVYLRACHLEIEIRGDLVRDEVIDEMQMIRALLYLRGVTPFMIPFVTTHSINDYSGINSRDSELLRDKLPDGVKEGLRSGDGTLEAWYCDRTWTLIRDASSIDITSEVFAAVTSELDRWKQVERDHPIVNIVRRLFNFAPMIPDDAASILQMWQGIESLFPSIQTEVTFRIALFVAQLCFPLQQRSKTYKEAKILYSTRSKIAHGASAMIRDGDWAATWALLRLCLRAVLVRGKLPCEEELMFELLPE
jgi:hypothetical protein